MAPLPCVACPASLELHKRAEGWWRSREGAR